MRENLNEPFKERDIEGLEKYDGVADFFRRATEEEKIAVFTEAARRSNEDQRKIMREAGIPGY